MHEVVQAESDPAPRNHPRDEWRNMEVAAGYFGGIIAVADLLPREALKNSCGKSQANGCA